MNPYKVAAGFFVNGEQYKSAQFLTGVPLLFSMIQAPQVRSAATLSEHMTRYGSLLMVPVPNGSWAVFPYQSPNGKRIPVPKAILDIFPNLDWNGTPEDLLKSLVHEVAEGRPVAHQALKRDFYWIPGNEFAQVYNKHSIFPTETFITFDLPSQPE
ncbi:hypothetical protein K2X30_14545 [bacterium]|nr:hypothetical protein [bacterium]